MQNRITGNVVKNDTEKGEELAKWAVKEKDFLIKVKSALDFADKKLRSELKVVEYE